jgi:hypothetical protein
MKRLLYILLFIPLMGLAQKPDFIRTPNSGNTIVDWNLKAKTLVLPHAPSLGLSGSQDSTGNVRFIVAPGDTSLYVRIAGVKWWKPNTVISPTSIAYTAGATLPITLTSFQTSYSNYGNYPKFEVVINNGTNKGLDITSQATISKGTATPPTTITINADDDGTGHLSDNILIIVKP